MAVACTGSPRRRCHLAAYQQANSKSAMSFNSSEGPARADDSAKISFTNSFMEKEKLESLRQHFMQMVSSYLHQAEARFNWNLFEVVVDDRADGANTLQESYFVYRR